MGAPPRLDYNCEIVGSCGCTSQHTVDLSQGVFALSPGDDGCFDVLVCTEYISFFFDDRRSGEYHSFSLKRP